MVSKNQIHEGAARIFDEVRSVRRHLHRRPELSFSENETAAYLKAKLEAAGIEVSPPYAGTGFVARIYGRSGGRRMALRGDMDALPITEQNEVEYASANPGVMHACGHDVHSACAFGAALLLHQTRDEWTGTVDVVFQPGEEKLPGGASLMIADGALHPDLTGIFGQHVFPELEAGKVGFRSGRYMASADELYFTVRGKGGHAALPHKNSDPVVATAAMVTALQQVVARFMPPDLPAVLSIGRIIADGATNVIPNTVEVAGTFRTFDEDWRSKAHERIAQTARETCAAFGVEVDVDIRKGYPFLVNDEGLTAKAVDAARDLLGPENVVDLELRLTAEDFAYYTQHMPGCFYRLGTASPDGRFTSSVHTPTFDIDESALRTGTAMMAWLALSGLEG